MPRKRILFLADRNILIDQTMVNDFRDFKGAMAKLSPNAKGVERVDPATGRTTLEDLTLAVNKATKQVDKSYEIYLSLYQAVSGTDEAQNIYKQFSPDFFDLVVVDECHRGSADEDSAWREILSYFGSATQIGLTATPKETRDISNSDYFGEPIFSYTLRQGIEDGYLAPYKVIRVDLDRDTFGWRPTSGMTDKHGHVIEDRVYNATDMNRSLVLERRDEVVAAKITEYLKATDRMAKTIVFCEDIDHAARMRQALANANADVCATQPNYVVQITGDNPEGKRELDNFIDPEKPYPVIATTSRLMSTGVDAQTCKLIVLDQNIKSMTLFKQIIGRGTRLREDLGKTWFTILDFKRATDNFADPAFDGDPVQIYEAGGRRSGCAARRGDPFRRRHRWQRRHGGPVAAHHRSRRSGRRRAAETLRDRRQRHGQRCPRAGAVPRCPRPPDHREPARLHPHQPRQALRLARRLSAGLGRAPTARRPCSTSWSARACCSMRWPTRWAATWTPSTCCCTLPGTCRR